MNKYQEFAGPLLNSSVLWKTSGHWDHYKEDMFVLTDSDGKEQALKPMNCPNAIKIYVSNIMTEPGQTDDYSVSDHINAIIEHCGEGLIDYCIYDTGEVIPEEFNINIIKLIFNIKYIKKIRYVRFT